MTIDLEKMQNAALAATQGEWKLAKPQPAAYFDGYINPVSGGELVELQVGINSSYGLLVWKMEDDEVSPKCQANATHIATANPSAILELIEKYKALESDLETERLRLAACGVAALGYFDGCKDEYRSASLEDTLRLYESNKELKSQLAEYKRQSQNEAEIKQLEIALRIKTEEHQCCAEDLISLSKSEQYGWKEAAIAWEVCASIHEKWAKGKDTLYSTRHADFEKHADDARRKLPPNG